MMWKNPERHQKKLKTFLQKKGNVTTESNNDRSKHHPRVYDDDGEADAEVAGGRGGPPGYSVQVQ